jgi:putative ABC transport system permease protein
MMRASETVRTAFGSLRGNRVRTLLMALGTVIGVAAVIVVLGVGQGARASVEGRIRSLGANLLTIRPEWAQTGAVRSGTVQTLVRADADALAKLDGIASVAPEMSAGAQQRWLDKNRTGTVIGTTPEYFDVRSLTIERGVPFSAQDVAERRRVVVIGSTIVEELFGASDPLGERLQLRGIAFQVIGVIESKGDGGPMSSDDQVIVPITVHEGVLFGQRHLTALSIQLADEKRADEVQENVRGLLRLRHRLAEDAPDDFQLRSQTEMLKTMGAVTDTLTALLGAVAAVSLVVGGIGIMNIMLSSVRERTREIGVRMAIGARRRDVLLQFLAEAVVVAVGGGLVGVALGYGGAFLVSAIGGWETRVPLYAPFLALSVSASIGVLFGVGPARRAASLDPVEALRQE